VLDYGTVIEKDTPNNSDNEKLLENISADDVPNSPLTQEESVVKHKKHVVSMISNASTSLTSVIEDVREKMNEVHDQKKSVIHDETPDIPTNAIVTGISMGNYRTPRRENSNHISHQSSTEASKNSPPVPKFRYARKGISPQRINDNKEFIEEVEKRTIERRKFVEEAKQELRSNNHSKSSKTKPISLPTRSHSNPRDHSS
jgi:hypothetical protein